MKWPMLTRRGVTYYHRQVVPLALRPLLDNRREIWKSLRTTDLEEAKVLSLRAGQEVARLFQSLRKKAAAAQSAPDTFGRDYKRRALVEDAQWRATRGQVDDEQLRRNSTESSCVSRTTRSCPARVLMPLCRQLLRRPTSESGRLRHGDGDSEGATAAGGA